MIKLIFMAVGGSADLQNQVANWEKLAGAETKCCVEIENFSVVYTVETDKFNTSKIMQPIAPKTVPGWKLEGTNWVPSSIDIICPFCNRPSNLVTHSYIFHPQSLTMVMMGRCVRCSRESKLWAIGVKSQKSNDGSTCDEVWMLPKPSIREISIPSDKLPSEIFDAYEEAVNCYNASFWRATVTECGRALEGVTLDKFSTKEDRQQLKSLSENKKPEDNEGVKSILFAPILELSSAIRLGRLTGAHFNIKGKADREVAEQVLDLTEYLIRYFYILSSNASELEAKIKALGDKGLSEDI